MAKPVPPTNTFQIRFWTTDVGYIRTVQVTIEEGVMDAMDSARVDLCDHPLYKDLERYVKENPSGRK